MMLHRHSWILVHEAIAVSNGLVPANFLLALLAFSLLLEVILRLGTLHSIH